MYALRNVSNLASRDGGKPLNFIAFYFLYELENLDPKDTILKPEDMARALYGLRRMDARFGTIKSIANSLSKLIEKSNVELTPTEAGLALQGLTRMNSRHVEVRSAILDGHRRWGIIVIEHLGNDTFIDKNIERTLANPLLHLLLGELLGRKRQRVLVEAFN